MESEFLSVTKREHDTYNYPIPSSHVVYIFLVILFTLVIYRIVLSVTIT